jgi:hypothetical protein
MSWCDALILTKDMCLLQDEEFGGFGGKHCMVVGGYSSILAAMAARLDVRLSCPVMSVEDGNDGVRVTVASGLLPSRASPRPSMLVLFCSRCLHKLKEKGVGAMPLRRAFTPPFFSIVVPLDPHLPFGLVCSWSLLHLLTAGPMNASCAASLLSPLRSGVSRLVGTTVHED